MQNIQNPKLCKKINRLSLEILGFGSARVHPESFSGEVVSPVYSRLYFITDGSFEIEGKDSGRFLLSAGNWYLIPSGYSFNYSCKNAMEHFYFHLKLCDFDGADLLSAAQKKPLCLSPETPPDLDFFSQCICSDDVVSGLKMRQKIFDVVLSFAEEFSIPIKAEDYSPYICRALAYIKQNLSMSLTISEIAENTFVSKSTLTKHFQKELNMSVNEYVSKCVMEQGERLLMTSNMSVRDISQRLGFSDQFYFSRRFKEYFNKSPQRYKKELHL